MAGRGWRATTPSRCHPRCAKRSPCGGATRTRSSRTRTGRVRKSSAWESCISYENLVDAELVCGRAAEMIPQPETLVATYRLREAFRAQLMVALYRTGRQVDALRACQEHREVLAEELGLDPSPELADLERRVLAHDPTLRLAEPAGLPLRGYRLGERLGTGRDGSVAPDSAICSERSSTEQRPGARAGTQPRAVAPSAG